MLNHTIHEVFASTKVIFRSAETEQIQQELQQVSEPTNFKAKEKEILQIQVRILAKDPGIQLLKQKLDKVLKELRIAGIDLD